MNRGKEKLALMAMKSTAKTTWAVGKYGLCGLLPQT